VVSATRAQHAVRLLVVLSVAGERVKSPPDPTGSVLAVRSEKRLQALDFWLRNPDYLADELVRGVIDDGLDKALLDVADQMLESKEPSLRHYPMPKWFYGAYEPLDDAMCLLEVHGLAMTARMGVPGNVRRTQFFLTSAGSEAATEIAADSGPLRWYAEQAELVMIVAGNDTGSRLKQRQYAQAEYAGTGLGSAIGPIHEHVRIRLREAREMVS
jgi:hypothetical protein